MKSLCSQAICITGHIMCATNGNDLSSEEYTSANSHPMCSIIDWCSLCGLTVLRSLVSIANDQHCAILSLIRSLLCFIPLRRWHNFDMHTNNCPGHPDCSSMSLSKLYQRGLQYGVRQSGETRADTVSHQAMLTQRVLLAWPSSCAMLNVLCSTS
ncbi:hypothetical protein KL938_002990 [Ogataea parapolymorpha]|nr:hypothetical protein KL938_002990 [Ogataea parapolymorpha]